MERGAIHRFLTSLKNGLSTFFITGVMGSIIFIMLLQHPIICSYFFKDYCQKIVAELTQNSLAFSVSQLSLSFFPLGIKVFGLEIKKESLGKASCEEFLITLPWKAVLSYEKKNTFIVIFKNTVCILQKSNKKKEIKNNFFDCSFDTTRYQNNLLASNNALASINTIQIKNFSLFLDEKKVFTDMDITCSQAQQKMLVITHCEKISPLSGKNINASFSLSSTAIEGALSCKTVTSDYSVTFSAARNLTFVDALWSGKLIVLYNKKELLDGRFSYNYRTGKYSLIATNHLTCTFGHRLLSLAPYESFITLSSDRYGRHCAQAKMYLFNRLTKKRKKFELTGLIYQDRLKLALEYRHKIQNRFFQTETLRSILCQLEASYRDIFLIDYCALKEKTASKTKVLAELSSHFSKKKVFDKKNKTSCCPNELKGFVSHDCVRLFFSTISDDYLSAHHVRYALSIKQDCWPLQGSMALDSGLLYIPENRTLITQARFNFSYNFLSNIASVSNLVFSLGKGTISLPYAVWQGDMAFNTRFLYAPLLLDNFFLNIKTDIYALLSGHVVIHKKEECPYVCKGALVLKNSLIQQSEFFMINAARNNAYLISDPESLKNMRTDISVTTEEPLTLKTDTFCAKIQTDLQIKRSEQGAFYGAGVMHLQKGTIRLLGKKFIFDSGSIQLSPHHRQAALIDVSAKARIHKYVITLYVNGAIEKPQIALEATPYLSQEQIMALLLSGSDHATLQTDLPAMLLHNLNTIFARNKHEKTARQTLFERLTRPLRFVQITPDFTNQSGRGGIKGIVSLGISDKLHAQIEKNFNLQEDFSFYLQYAVTDDLYLKAVKDPRGDFGAELEFRVKL